MTRKLDITERKVPEAEFVTYLDRSLKKSNPDKSIPWEATMPPDWANDYHPRLIVDLGCGLGSFTVAVIAKLAEWGCLDRLEKLVLVEGDTSLHPQGEKGLKKELAQRIDNALLLCNISKASVEIFITQVACQRFDNESVSQVHPLEQLLPSKPDLVISSHFTYYFEDGSGHGLIQAIASHYLHPFGKIWCVIRNKNCPIYKKRKKVLEEVSQPDPKPYDYAEYFQADVIPSFKGLKLRTEQYHGYNIKGDKCNTLAYAFMWRELPDSNNLIYEKAVSEVCNELDPLFSETHFILECSK